MNIQIMSDIITYDKTIGIDKDGWSITQLRVIDILRILNISTDNIPEQTLVKHVYVSNIIPVTDAYTDDKSLILYTEE